MSSRNEEQWAAMLDRLAQRDGSVELSRGQSGDDAPLITYRTRVFEVQPDGCIIVATPLQAVQDRVFRVGDDIDLTLMVNDERMVATCTLHESFSYKANESMELTCYRLSAGRRPVREQRRSNFRVSVAAVDFQPSKLKSDADPFECDVQMVNLSAGGMGVSIRANRRVLNQIKRTRQFTCSARLNDKEQIDVPVRVAHLSAFGEDGLYLGLKFEFATEQEASYHEQFMQQRCTEIQRMQLRRRRA